MNSDDFMYQLPDDESIHETDNNYNDNEDALNLEVNEENSSYKFNQDQQVQFNHQDTESTKPQRQSLIMSKINERESSKNQKIRQIKQINDTNFIAQSNNQIYTNRKSIISDNYSQSFESVIEDQTQQFIDSNLSSARKLYKNESEVLINDNYDLQPSVDEKTQQNINAQEIDYTQQSQFNIETQNNYIIQSQQNNRNFIQKLESNQTIKTQSVIMIDENINDNESQVKHLHDSISQLIDQSPNKSNQGLVRIKSQKKRQRPPTANEFKRINQFQCTNDASKSDISCRMMNMNNINNNNNNELNISSGAQSQQHLPRNSINKQQQQSMIQSQKQLNISNSNNNAQNHVQIYQQNLNQLAQINQKIINRNHNESGNNTGISPKITQQTHKSQNIQKGLNHSQSQMSAQKKRISNNKTTKAKADDIFDKLFDTIRVNLQTEDKQQRINYDQFLFNQEKSDYIQDLKMNLEKQHLKNVMETQQKYKNFQLKSQQLLERIKQKQKILENNLDMILNKVEIEIHQQNKTQSYKILSQGSWYVVQNWLFSTILDQEKCMRYSQLKSFKQLEFVKQQKLAYQESKILKTIESLFGFKNFQYLKFTQSQKAKQVKSDILEYLRDQQNQQSIQVEQIAVLRSKPYLKQSNFECIYEIQSQSQRLLSLQNLTSNLGSIIKTSEELFHINPIKIQAKLKKIDPEQIIIQDGQIQLLQDPECCSKDPRVFICCKDVSSLQTSNGDNFLSEKSTTSVNGKNISTQHNKLVQEARPFLDFFINQKNNNPNSKDNVFKIKSNEIQIKKIKGTNQVKIQKDQNHFALLNECKAKDVLNSQVFQHFFDVNNKNQDSHLLSNFYIIEENSIFSTGDCQPNNQIVSKDRKVKQIRRLDNFEVLLLILKLVKTQNSVQNIEIKFQSDTFKKIQALKTLKQDRAREMTTSSTNSLDEQTKYMIVNKIEQKTGNLLKQYYLKVTLNDISKSTIMRQNSLAQQSAAVNASLQVHQCNWSNCLQVLDPSQYPMMNDIIQKQMQTIQQTPQSQGSSNNGQQIQSIPHSQSTRKRPQSGNKNSKDQAIMRKITRLNIMLELEIKDSVYLRFLKKFKLNKDKSSKTLLPQSTFNQNNNNNANISANISLQQASANVIPSLSTAVTNTIPTIAQQDLRIQTSQGQQRKDLSNVISNSQLILCTYHRDMELFIATKLNIRLQPQSLICNNFTKALKNYEIWKDEIKSSLAYDLLVDTGKGNYLKENIHKIFNFSVNQGKSSSSHPNIYNLLEILQQQPQQINILDQFYVWIDRYMNSQKLFFIKNPHFNEANIHFIQQMNNLNSNLRQTLENEKYIVNEIRKWISSQDLPKSYLRDVYGQILEIIRVKDVIYKFQQFQFIIDRINTLKGTQQYQQQIQPNNGQILAQSQGVVGNRPSMNAQFISQFSNENNNNHNGTLSSLPKIIEQPQNVMNVPPTTSGLSLNTQGRIIQMSGMQPNIIRHDYKPQGVGAQSSVVEKLTSIYGVSQGGLTGFGNSIKKNQYQQNDFTQSTIRQLIEQKVTGGSTATAEQLYLKQNTNPQQQQQNQQQPSFLARKYSAGNKKDFSLPPPSTQDMSQLHQYSAKNEVPQINLINNGGHQGVTNTGEYIVNRVDHPTSMNYNHSLNNSNNISKEVIGLPNGYINTNMVKNGHQAGYNPNQSISQASKKGANGGPPQNYQSSPMSKSLYKAPFGQIPMATVNASNIQVNHKQRASSAYKQRQENQPLEVSQQQQNMSYQSNNVVMRPNTSTSQIQANQIQQQTNQLNQSQYQMQISNNIPNPQYYNQNMILSSDQINAQYNVIVPILNTQQMVQNNLHHPGNVNQNFLNRKVDGVSSLTYQQQQQQPPKFPINNQFTLQQQQLQQIYNTKINKPQLIVGQTTQTSGFGHTITNFSQQINGQINSHSKQRQDRQQAIVMTYSNAVPRIGSAHLNEKEKKKMSGTFYEKAQKKAKKQSSNNSDRKQIKLNNFVNLK